MHPILFRIPLPHEPLRLWWGLTVVAAFCAVFGIVAAARHERDDTVSAAVVVVGCLFAGWKWRSVVYEAPSLPIYAYGVMLGLSLVVGWYLTLRLAEQDGLPKTTMANCYVVTALCALAGARLLYVLTNPDEFQSIGDVFAVRSGGLVAYGGFIGGLLGSWAFLYPKKIPLLAWADDAVPSLAAGLVLTRIGCYLFGCDFGQRLGDGAPQWLKTLGTFPHWPVGTLASGDGSPAYIRHLELARGTQLEAELVRMNTSFPVHPTQLYESLVGALLLALLLWQRRYTRFRGQVFFLFVFAYGYSRFLLELWRDDVERGSYGPTLDAHLLIPLCLFLFAVAFLFGVSLGMTRPIARSIARVSMFVPPLVAYLALRPAKFAQADTYQLSTSQIVGLVSALAVSYFYGRYWVDTASRPNSATTVGNGVAADPQSRPTLRQAGAHSPNEIGS
jgi:phosphatidylglycerol:prolipoprotein diacylglycerol transferase